MIDLPVDLPAELVPLSWLLGVWEGTGVIDYDAGDHRYQGEFTHRVSFSHDGGDALNYSATAMLLREGAEPQILNTEVGFWRIARARTDDDPGPALLPPRNADPVKRTVDDVEALRNDAGSFDLVVSLVHADGNMELCMGTVAGPRIDLETDAVIRPLGAREYLRGSRMYGLVDAHLLWAWDIAAVGGELASHASARLAKVD